MIGLKIHKSPNFRKAKPRMVAALPDMGNVAGIGLGYLAKKLHADLFAELYSYWPPFVSYNNGVVDYAQSSYRFYFVEECALIIFNGDFNPPDPRRLYELCYEVLRMAQRTNTQALYSIGAALRGAATGADPKVFGVVNRHEMLNQLLTAGVIVLQGEGQITGFNGLVLGLAKERGINALCLLGEIENPNILQPKAAQAILHVLTRMLGISPLDMSELEEEDKRKKFMEQQMNYLGKVMERGGPPGIA